ncbi:outer membrane cobalamin receptor [Polymorphobacter multimanifer]|uniref:Outer membrane cobalamin receptor n=2 Tax=Polymorphobacter multimanifer TaxID=1070431 RepID=A0A841L1C6_9SPHN|nr:outer membrane cobalamin receptor [Polymorphobacter multimanifer]
MSPAHPLIFALGAAAGLVLSAGPAFAQAAAQLPIIVTASRLDAASIAITTLTPADLATSDSLADALARLPEVYVQQPGGRSGFGALFLRGADPNFTTVLLDGIPLNNATSSRGGAVNLSELGTAGIARVEIAAGPLSSVLGSGSLAGAVNLVVAGGTDVPRLTATAGAGTRGDLGGVLGWRGPISTGAGAAITAEYADDGEASPGAAFEMVTLTAKVASRDPARPDRLLLRFNDVVSRQFPDNSGGPAFATRRSTERRTAREWLAGGTLRLVEADALSLDASASWLDRRDTSNSPGVAGSALDPFGVPAGEDVSRYRRALGQLVLGVGGPAARLVLGTEIGHERGSSDGSLDFGFPVPTSFRAARTSYAAFAEAARSRGPFSVGAAARLDAIDGFAPRLTGRLGAQLQPAESDLALSVGAGTSFKAPSFYALGNPFVGNPALRAESGRSAEAGLVWSPSNRQRLALSVFHNRYTDLIDFVADPAPRLVNRARVLTTGAVASLAQPLGRTADLSLSVQYADTRDAAGGTPLLNRPAWRFGGAFSWRPHATLALSARYDVTDTRFDASVPTGVQALDAYGLLALSAEWQPHIGTRIILTLDNALDADFADAIGFPGPARRGRIRITRTF